MGAPIRVGLTLRVVDAPDYDEPRDAISHDWIRTLCGWGMTPVLIPNLVPDPAAYLREAAVDLLVLTGGDSLGETPARDETERRLLDSAQQSALPALGVCRGMQLMSAAAGGKTETIEGHVASTHGVTTEAPFSAHYARGVEVNSFHELAIAQEGMGDGYRIAAVDADGFVEAMVHEDLPFAGVMWHPERADAPAADRGLVESLAREGAFWLDRS